MLTELQKRKVLHAFRLWDGNGDGQVEAADFVRMADRLAASRGWAKGSAAYEETQQAYQAAWQYLQTFADVNHNHQVSPDEWLNQYDDMLNDPERYHQLLVGIAQRNFEAADQDGDGQWTLEEYRQYLRTLAAPEDHAEEVFRQADVNGDGHISQEMFTHLLNQYFQGDDPDAVGNWLLGSYETPSRA